MLFDCTESSGGTEKGYSYVRSGEPAASIVSGFTPNPLALPRINEAVVSKYSVLDDKERWAKLAIGFLEAGFISSKSEIAPAYELVYEAAQKWRFRHCQDLNYLNFALSFTCTEQNIHWGNPYAYGEPLPECNFLLISGQGGYPRKEIGTVLEAFEQEVTGFGETILSLVETLGWKLSVLPLIPPTLNSLACHHLWCGMDTEDEWRNYIRSEWEENDESNIPDGPGILQADFPAWVLRPRLKLKLAHLRSLATRTDRVGKAAAIAVKLWCFRNREFGSLRGTDLDPALMTCYLRWKSDDIMPRVVDDLDQTLGQGETSTEILGIEYIPMDSTQFKKWLADSSGALKAIKLLDDLIGLIAIPFKETT